MPAAVRRTFGPLGAVSILAALAIQLSAAESATPSASTPAGGTLAAKLAAMPANSWLDLKLSWRGGHEVPACFDQANRLFFKYGGCGDGSPRIRISFPKGDPRYPNGYSNACWVADLGQGAWVQRRPYDCSWPTSQPANGCSRGYCYDSKRKVIWMYGGISDGGGGGDQWDMVAYDGAADTFTWSKAGGQPNRPPGGDSAGGDVFTYDSTNDVIVMPRGKVTLVFKPGRNAWEARSTPDAPPSPGHDGSLTFDPAAGKVIYPHARQTRRKAKDLGPTSRPDLWRPTEKGFEEYEFETWTYDAASNKWENAKPAAEPSPAYRQRFGLTYDSKNKVVILVGGSSNTWDSKEQYFNDVWVYDSTKNTWTKMGPPKPWPTGKNAWRDNRSCAYDEPDNVVLWTPNDGNLWAYRYR